MPAASMASPQRSRSLSYSRTRAESSSSVTAESASWRSVATSSSDQSRGSRAEHAERADDPAARPGQRGAEVGADLARGHRREVAYTRRRCARRGRPARRSPAAVTVQSDSSSGLSPPTTPGGRPPPAATIWTSVSSETWLVGAPEQSGGEFGQPVQSVRACVGREQAGAPRRCGRRRGSGRRQRRSPRSRVRDGSAESSTGALLPGRAAGDAPSGPAFGGPPVGISYVTQVGCAQPTGCGSLRRHDQIAVTEPGRRG